MTIVAGHWEVKHTGTLDFKQLYQQIHDWVLEREYSPSRHDHEFPETLYFDSRSQPAGREVWIWWRCNYVPEDNPFYRYNLRINFFANRMKDMDVMVANKKQSVQWGEFRIIIDGLLETDVKGEWQRHPLLKHLYRFFVERVMWKDIEKRRTLLISDAEDLIRTIKAFYGTHHWEPLGKAFVPKLGLQETNPY